MSSKPRLRFFRTVKFKVAVWYAVLFLLASTATFFSVYWTIDSIMAGKSKDSLKAFVREMELRFRRDSDVGDEADWIPSSKTPPEVFAAALRAVDGLKLGEARVSKSGGRTSFDFTGFLPDGALCKIVVDESGRVSSTETVSFKERLRRLEEDFRSVASSEGASKIYFLLLSPGGEILAKSDLRRWPALSSSSSRRVPELKNGSCFSVESLRRRHRDARVYDRLLPDGLILEAGQSVLEERKAMGSYLSISLSVLGGMTLAGSFVGWFIARRFMAGVERVSSAASSIGKGDFSKRVAIGGEGEEIDRLALSFNEMIDKIQGLISELKGISDNVAHDLRTPLTRIRGSAEVALSGSPGVEELSALAGETVEECDRLLLMINTMLYITQAESGLLPLDKERVDLKALLAAAHELFLPLAEDKSASFEMDLPQEELFVAGDKLRLQRVVSNLLDNALKFVPAGGCVKISAGASGAEAWFAISDNGRGIPLEEQARVFERFYRCDSSRSLPGNGLGLSLVRAIVKAHGGAISLKSAPGEGCVFTVRLPSAS